MVDHATNQISSAHNTPMTGEAATTHQYSIMLRPRQAVQRAAHRLIEPQFGTAAALGLSLPIRMSLGERSQARRQAVAAHRNNQWRPVSSSAYCQRTDRRSQHVYVPVSAPQIL